MTDTVDTCRTARAQRKRVDQGRPPHVSHTTRWPPFDSAHPGATGNLMDFYDPAAPDLLARWEKVGAWFEARADIGLDPYQRVTTTSIGTRTTGRHRNGTPFAGINFASQDYLSLSTHPRIIAAASDAAQTMGVHSAGSAALMGNTALSVELENRLAAFTGYKHCTVFPIGWAAGYGAVKTLVRRHDHVIIDALAHACLQEAASDATPNVHRSPHLSNEAVARRLGRIRAASPDAGILVVTESLFSMDSDAPNIAELQELCDRFDATLLVDCAHDLGALGATGRGILENQHMIGKVDVLMGSFSKTFASTGGFVACNSPAFTFGLRCTCGPSTFTNAMTPIQAAIILKALEIVTSTEGTERRNKLMHNVLRLRQSLEASDFTLLGMPSAIVPALLGDGVLSRLMTRTAFDLGAIVNLVEHPAVARNGARWRLQVMSDHEEKDIDQLCAIATEARKISAHYLQPNSDDQL